MRCIDVSTTELNKVVATLREGRIALLVGSGVSGFQPSSLPSGEALSQQLARLLSDGMGKTASIVEVLIRQCAFEHIMEACPYAAELRERLAVQFDCDEPNDAHRSIATLVRQGIIQHVITTNYDRCLDVALAGVVAQVVRNEDENRDVDPNRSVYFKIHGCASRPLSLVYTLSGERKMDSWKAGLLRTLVREHLLVVGYSGKDFEICPELASLRPSIAWNCYSAPDPATFTPSASCIRLLKTAPSVALVGDMSRVFNAFGIEKLSLVRGAGRPIPDKTFLVNGDPDQAQTALNVWRCELFRSIGCADAARIAASQLLRRAATERERAGANHYLGLAAFHAGQYRRAAHHYQAAAENEPVVDLRTRRLFDAVEALRCAGRRRDAQALLGSLESECGEPRYLPPILVRKLLLETERVERLRVARRKRAAERHKAKAEELAVQLKDVAEKYGAQIELAQCDQLMRRLRDGRQAAQHQSFTFLTAVERFHQLGYVVAKASSMRRELLDGECTADRKSTSDLAEQLVKLGAAAEAWKFSVMALRAGERSRAGRHCASFVRNNLRCEYTPGQRLTLLAQTIRDTLKLRM